MTARTAVRRSVSSRRTLASLTCAVLVGMALWIRAPELRAEPARKASAAELAEGACRLGRWAAAVDLMRVVGRVERGAGHWLCLARAQLHTGQWVAALDSYDELAELELLPAKDRGAFEHERTAQQQGAAERQDLEAQLAWVQIVPSAPLPASVRLSLDGEQIARARLGTEFPVQPGVHAFSVQARGGAELQHWRLAPGEHRRVTLSVPAASSDVSMEPAAPSLARRAVAPRSAVARQPQPPPTATAKWSRYLLYGGGIGFGASIAVMAASSGSEGVFKTGLTGVGLSGVSLMAGATLRIVDAFAPSPREAPVQAPRRLQVQPWIGTNVAGVSGSF